MEKKLLAVPVMLGTLVNGKHEELFARLTELGATEVVICFFNNVYDPFADLEDALGKLKTFDACFRQKGYDVSVWIATLNLFHSPEFHFLTNADGEKTGSWNCPMDEKFVLRYCDFVKKIARTGVRKIVLEDDYRLQFPSVDAACFCDQHMQFYSEYLGKPVTREDMKRALSEGPSEYRTAWMEGNRKALENFAVKIREAIDEIDESITVRLCCGPSLFGGDGSDAFALADIFAGKTGRKELRLIGAPYWGTMTNMNLASAIDFARHQALECKKRGVITVAEGDPWPRPRHIVPAAELEFFHTVTIADGNFDGIMKYGLDYTSDFDYETGYAKQAEKNKALYKDIERIFAGKKAVGVYLHEPFDRVERESAIAKSPDSHVIYSAGRKFANDLSLPVCFEAGGVNLLFGENARGVDRALLKNGSVLDISAAHILQSQGVDVGIRGEKTASPDSFGFLGIAYEEYYAQKDTVALYRQPGVCRVLTLDARAKELSRAHYVGVECTGAYLYENAEGERFLVYNFDLEEDGRIRGLVRSYHRQRQFIDACEWLHGTKPDAVMAGNPDLYILTKKSENALAIGLWNHFADETMQSVIELGKAYKKAEFVNCAGRLEGDKIVLTSPIGAYGFGFIEVFD